MTKSFPALGVDQPSTPPPATSPSIVAAPIFLKRLVAANEGLHCGVGDMDLNAVAVELYLIDPALNVRHHVD